MNDHEDAGLLVGSYPRNRQPLPASQAEIYDEEYKINRGVRGGVLYRTTAALEGWMHRRIAAENGGGRLLELGAGTFNHLRFEQGFTRYDAVEPSQALLSAAGDRDCPGSVYPDVSDVPPDAHYDRIFSIAVLEHLDDLPRIVAASALHLAPGGVFQAGIPAEGGFVWSASWRLTTGIAYRLRTGLAYGPVMRHEHINTAAEIIAVIRHLFADVRVSWFPLPMRNLAFYGYVAARMPNEALCRTICRKSQ
jgi:SAM-dependent methyltransferase